MQQPVVEGGLPQPQQTVFQSPFETFVFRTPDGQMFIGSPVTQKVNIEPSKSVTTLSEGHELVSHFLPIVSKVCGVLFFLLGLLLISGGVVESVSLDGSSRSDFVPYWCGAVVILCAVFVIIAACRVSNIMIIVALIANITCLAFGVTALVKCAISLRDLSYARNACNDWSSYSCNDIDLTTAGYAITIGGAGATIILSIMFGLELVDTFVKGSSTKVFRKCSFL